MFDGVKLLCLVRKKPGLESCLQPLIVRDDKFFKIANRGFTCPSCGHKSKILQSFFLQLIERVGRVEQSETRQIMYGDNRQMAEISGPPCYKNWIAAEEGKPSREAYECPLFTDADINDGRVNDYGPYKFLNVGPISPAYGAVRPIIVLRAEWHLATDYEYSAMDETDPGYYHGGDATTKLLLSHLSLGIRVKEAG